MGAQGQLTRGTHWRSSRTKYKRSKIVFSVTSIALTLALLGTNFLKIIAQSLIWSPGTIDSRHSHNFRTFEQEALDDESNFQPCDNNSI